MKSYNLSVAALGAVIAFSAGCNNDRGPILAAKLRYERALAVMGAYGRFLDIPKDTPKTDIRYRVADHARKKIIDATVVIAAAPPAPAPKDPEAAKEPWTRLGDHLKSINFSCSSTVMDDLDHCFKSVEGTNYYLGLVGEKVPAAGLPADTFPGKVTAWATPEVKAKAERLDVILKAPDPGAKLTTLWKDPSATYEALDAACKEATSKITDDEAKKAAAGDGEDARELAQISAASTVSSIKKCVNLLNYKLMDKVLGSCLGDAPDTKCFHEGSCSMVRGLRDSLQGAKPSLLPGASEEEPETLPIALQPKAKQAVALCSPYFR